MTSQDNLGQTILHLAVESGLTKCVEVLLKAQPTDVNVSTRTKRTPLHMAAANGHLPISQLLSAQNGCDLNALDLLNMTPLHWAVERNHPAVVELLSNQLSCNLHAVDVFGRTALDVAILNESVESQVVLMKATSRRGISPFPSCCSSSSSYSTSVTSTSAPATSATSNSSCYRQRNDQLVRYPVKRKSLSPVAFKVASRKLETTVAESSSSPTKESPDLWTIDSFSYSNDLLYDPVDQPFGLDDFTFNDELFEIGSGQLVD